MTVLARDQECSSCAQPDGTCRVLGPGRPLALAFAPGGQRLASAGPGQLVRTWDQRGNLLAEAHTPAAARAISYVPDGTRLLVLDAAGGISVLEPQTLAILASWSVEGPANSIACDPTSQTVACFVRLVAQRYRLGRECWSIAERQESRQLSRLRSGRSHTLLA